MRWTPILFLFGLLVLLVGAVPGAGEELPEGYLTAARKAVAAQIKVGDLKAEKGDLNGAVVEYRKALALYESAIAKAAKARQEKPGAQPTGEAEAKEPEPAPKDDGTPAGRKRVVDYYVRILSDEKSGKQLRYNATVQLGELRDARARPALEAALKDDTHQLVRRAAAWALGRLGKEGVPSIPALIAQVGSEQEYVGYMAARALGDITAAALNERVGFGFKPTMALRERRLIQEKWRDWYEQNKGRFEWQEEKK